MGRTEDSTDAIIARAKAKNAQLRQTAPPPAIKKEVKFESPLGSPFASPTTRDSTEKESAAGASSPTSSSFSRPASPTPTYRGRNPLSADSHHHHRETTAYGFEDWHVHSDFGTTHLGHYMFTDKDSAVRAAKQMPADHDTAQGVWDYRLSLAKFKPHLIDTKADPTKGIGVQMVMTKKEDDIGLADVQAALEGVSLAGSSKSSERIKEEPKEEDDKDKEDRFSPAPSGYSYSYI